MDYEEALKTIGPREHAEVREAVVQFLLAAKRVFGLAEWKAEADLRIIVENNGSIHLQPRIGISGPSIGGPEAKPKVN